MNIDETALILADKALKNNFDPEAYIVKYIAEIKLASKANEVDYVPGSNIDEGIQQLLKLFVTYYNNKSVETLNPLLLTLRQILSELYHTCNSDNERALMQEFITMSQNIL